MSEQIGDNARKRLNGLARMITDHLNDIADLQEEVKQLKAEAKSEGYDLKALGQVIKEMRKGADFQCAQLSLELVLDTYRGAVGLPTTLEQAQSAAAATKESVPEPKGKRARSRLAGLSANENDDADDLTPPPRKDLN